MWDTHRALEIRAPGFPAVLPLGLLRLEVFQQPDVTDHCLLSKCEVITIRGGAGRLEPSRRPVAVAVKNVKLSVQFDTEHYRFRCQTCSREQRLTIRVPTQGLGIHVSR